MTRIQKSLLLIIFNFACFGAYAALPSVTHSLVALQGYDPVAYFTQSKPVKGNGNHVYRYQGITYIFSTRQNLNRFRDDPNRYMPQFGGYCAYAVIHKQKVVASPLAWKIVDGKLYLNLNHKVQAIWEKNLKHYIEKAHQNWPEIVDKKAY